MNSKKAKLMRKYGKVDKKTKRNYNELSHEEKGLLADIYKFNLERRKPTQ